MNKKDLKEIGSIVEQKLEPINKKLDALTLDVIEVQKKTDVLPDLHSYIMDTKEKGDNLGERVERLETAA